MRKIERIIWISLVSLLLVISLFGIFINKAWAATIDSKMPNFKKLIEVFNQEIIWKDFGYEDLEFDWVAEDMIEPDIASQIYDRDLKNGSLTLNEVRQKKGETPFGPWADKPMILTAEGFKPIQAEDNLESEDKKAEEVGGEKPYKEQKKVEGEKIDKTLTNRKGITSLRGIFKGITKKVFTNV